MEPVKVLEDHIENLERAITFIEKNIETDFTVAEVAKQARMSLWHFQKVFHALVGEPVKSYIRRRRLTYVAKMLRNSKNSMAGLARIGGFRSAEAFLRAFSRQFGMTPGEFRKSGVVPAVPAARAALNHEYVRTMFDQLKPPEVTIIEVPRKTVFGICGQFYPCFAEGANGPEVTPGLWKKLASLIDRHQIKGILDYWALVSRPDENETNSARETDGNFDYRATFECDNSALPATGLSTLRAAFTETDFPGGTYAVFEQTNPPKGIVHSLNYMFCIWLGKSDYEFDNRIEFEKYAPDYQPDNPSGFFLYGIPVKRRR